MTRGPIEVFLTGASGFLGHYVLAELLTHPHTRCRVLLRPPVSKSYARLDRLLADIGLNLSALTADQRVVPVEGELPDSLGAADLSGLDLVLHAAGNTAFRANGSGEPARTNVDGTRALLSLAAEAKIRRFVLVSTAYVWGEQVGHLPEVFCPSLPPVRNDYERSKWQAEQLVWQWGKRSGDATICRPSILFGDSRTGRASAMQGLYLVARATEILARAMDDSRETDCHHIPLRILGRGDAACNVVPVDWAARQIAGIALEPATASSVHHVTNPDPPTHQEVKCWLEEYFDIAGGRFSDATWPLDDANHYEDLFYSLGNICLDYFRHGLIFESRCAAEIPSGQRLIDRESFLQCMKYAQATNWCRTPRETNAPRPPAGAVDPKWYFESFLPRVVPRSVVAKVNELTAIAQYTITGPNGGSWISRFERGHLEETQAVPTALKPEFEYRLSHEDLVEIVTCRKPLQDVFFRGSAEMFGDVERALKMVPIIGEFLKEFPVTGAQSPALAC
ncbi:MAG: NAD-dependent epimerase/dehydratase family protein [bacterium]|nr:NAD-dependent epimerase/dehydratase family protein [bacterium]